MGRDADVRTYEGKRAGERASLASLVGENNDGGRRRARTPPAMDRRSRHLRPRVFGWRTMAGGRIWGHATLRRPQAGRAPAPRKPKRDIHLRATDSRSVHPRRRDSESTVSHKPPALDALHRSVFWIASWAQCPRTGRLCNFKTPSESTRQLWRVIDSPAYLPGGCAMAELDSDGRWAAFHRDTDQAGPQRPAGGAIAVGLQAGAGSLCRASAPSLKTCPQDPAALAILRRKSQLRASTEPRA